MANEDCTYVGAKRLSPQRVGDAGTLPWRRSLERTGWLLVIVLTLVFVTSVALLGHMLWRSVARLEEIGAHVEHSELMRRADQELEQALLVALASDTPVDALTLARVRSRLREARNAELDLDPTTSEQLGRVLHMLASAASLPPARLLPANELMDRILAAEGEARVSMLSRLGGDSRREFALALGLFASLPLLGLFVSLTLRQQIVHPLRELHGLLSRLADGRFESVPVESVPQMLLPLFRNYNYLVSRLQELEEQHRLRARTLEAEVRAATEAILEQHRSLARAERMAAVGELTAGLAHELRNPLAGILMSMSNLRSESEDPDVTERLGSVIDEMQRLTRLLNQHLSKMREAPEAVRPVELDALVEELVALVRYQVPQNVSLETDIPPELRCLLPRDRIRQALLNLILNSVVALGEAGGTVQVAAHSDGEQLRISVADDGPGFSDDFIHSGVRAFGSYRESGTGLGLAMVRRVALDLGGELKLTNRQPRGARAELVVPCRRA
jgi:two-component system NtrC family sensor kinase